MYTLKNKDGVTKEVKKGFSWTTLLFGSFVPLVRGDWFYFFISIVAAMLTFGISWLVFPFIYNRLYLERLLSKGYEIQH